MVHAVCTSFFCKFIMINTSLVINSTTKGENSKQNIVWYVFPKQQILSNCDGLYKYESHTLLSKQICILHILTYAHYWNLYFPSNHFFNSFMQIKDMSHHFFTFEKDITCGLVTFD